MNELQLLFGSMSRFCSGGNQWDLRDSPGGKMRGDFHIGDWLVQPQLNQIRSSAATIRIEPKAMAVLVCLATHQDQVLSKQDLKREVWPNTYVTDHVLVRCISDLRKALRDDPRAPKTIQTISRGGYRLIPPRIDVPSGSDGPTPASIPPQALQEYLKGRYCYEQGSHISLLRAIVHLEKAVANYPPFARAYAALADCYNFMAQSGFENPHHCYHCSKSAALKALELDDSGAEPHASLALALMCHDQEWSAAETGFRKAIGLNPDCACARHGLALCLLARRRTVEAIREAETARSIDPVSPVFAGMLVRALFAAGRYPDGTAVCLEMLELRPGYPDLEWLLCESYWHQGRSEQARQRLEIIRESADQHETKVAVYDAIYSGEPVRAIRLLEALDIGAASKDPMSWAKACALVGDARLAFKWLGCALERKDTAVLLLDVDPCFSSLRSAPQFEPLLRNLRLR